MKFTNARVSPLAAALCISTYFYLPAAAQPELFERPIGVVIGFNHTPGPAEEALIRAAGGSVKHRYSIIPAIAASLPSGAVRSLENHPAVRVIDRDVLVRTFDEYSSVWGVTRIGAQAVHATSTTGLGAKVCVIDTGIDLSHPDLAGRYVGGYDLVHGTTLPLDDNGHGTHISGIIAAVLNGLGIVGVAPASGILAYKAFDASGTGPISNVIAAIDLCKQAGGNITNNSYGIAIDPGSLFKSAFDAANNSGILNLAAAGNAPSLSLTCGTVMYPARYDSVVAVAATDAADTVPVWSCRGPEVELAAPGADIYSTYPYSAYAFASGTSMAAPHAAGVAALVLDCGLTRDLNGDGRINNVDVRLWIQQTARDLAPAGRDPASGFGRIQADQAALNCTGSPPPVQPPIAPTGLTVTGANRNAIRLAWTDNASNENTFELWRCAGSNCTSFANHATLTAGSDRYSDVGISRLTIYSYKVRAVNSGGASAFSNVVSASSK